MLKKDLGWLLILSPLWGSIGLAIWIFGLEEVMAALIYIIGAVIVGSIFAGLVALGADLIKEK